MYKSTVPSCKSILYDGKSKLNQFSVTGFRPTAQYYLIVASNSDLINSTYLCIIDNDVFSVCLMNSLKTIRIF